MFINVAPVSILFVSLIIFGIIGLCALVAWLMDGSSVDGARFLVMRNWFRRHRPPAQTLTNLLLVAANFLLVIVTAGLGWVAWQQYEFGKVTEQPYINFGSREGKLIDFGTILPGDKPILILHFYNAGRSTARHFTVHVTTNMHNTSNWTHRRRYAKPDGEVITEGAGNEVDLTGQAEHKEYLTDPQCLVTEQALADPKTWFSVQGEFEYCDDFGRYHCQSFGAEYRPSPIADFIGAPRLPCIIGPDRNAKVMANLGFKEIEPCEQSNEPEFLKLNPQ